MGRKKARGLRLREGIWHINGIHIKGVGKPLYESTGTSDIEEACAYRDHRIAELRRAALHGERPKRYWRDAAAEHLERALRAKQDSVDVDAYHLKMADEYIGGTWLHLICDETLTPLIAAMRKRGNKSKTIRNRLEVIRRILNACTRWKDPNTGITWLEQAPAISMPKWNDRRPGYPLSWDEQALLLPLLPDHLATMALYDVNTGLRDEELCSLRWRDWWEMPEIGATGFVIPETKNEQARIVVHNRIAQRIIEAQRGKHPEYVFVYQRARTRDPKCYREPQMKARRIETMNNTAWQNARAKLPKLFAEKFGREAPAGLTTLHVHDLRHTFGRRLRAAGVMFETRQDLLGHKNGNVTTDYSAAEAKELYDAVQKIAGDGVSTPTLTLIRKSA